MTNYNQVSSVEIAANAHATKNEKLGFVNLCKETTIHHTDVVKIGGI